MKKKMISDAVANIGTAYIEKAANYEVTKKNATLAWQLWGSIAACLCLGALVVTGVWHSGIFDTPSSSVSGNPNTFVITGDSTGNTNHANQEELPKTDSNTSDKPIDSFENALIQWKGKTISVSLGIALEKASETDVLNVGLTPLIVYDDVNTETADFVYNGKTLKEYYDIWKNRDLLLEKLGMLLKMGEELKYGETLYLTGSPDGTKWAKAYYEEVVEKIGKEVLETYIVNGEFLSDRVLEDQEKIAAQTPDIDYQKACDEYLKSRLSEEYKRLIKEGISAEFSPSGTALTISVTKSELEHLDFENTESWHFSVPKEETTSDDQETEIGLYTTENLS